jgi:hypothetical protein
MRCHPAYDTRQKCDPKGLRCGFVGKVCLFHKMAKLSVSAWVQNLSALTVEFGCRAQIVKSRVAKRIFVGDRIALVGIEQGLIKVRMPRLRLFFHDRFDLGDLI